MTATVTNRGMGVYPRFHAWCNECSDGINSHASRAHQWAEQHNREHHPETETP